MMRPHSILRREDKRHVAVMARFVNLVNKRWSNAIPALPVQAVAHGTDRIISACADLLLLCKTCW